MADRATKGGGVATDLSFMARLVTAAKFVVTGASDAWFGPSQPINPSAPPEVKGRAFDYPVAYNTNIQPRSTEAVSFPQMRALADSYDLLRIIIETCKDQIATQEWTIKPKDPQAKEDDRCKKVKDFLQFPDKENDHATWLRMLLEDMLVIDAPTIYPRLTKGGDLYALEIVDGGTIKRVINGDGRTPLPPSPAYQQALKGVPAVDYTADELIYRPRNKRSNRIYGFSPVEQIIMTVNIALRRQLHQLEFYTEGNTPDLLFRVPETWQPEQIKQMQLWWDTLINDTASRRKAKFIPGGVDPYDTKTAALKDEYDEWLARVVCFCFSISPQPFIKEVNRATAQTSAEASKEEGKGPRMLWVKQLHDFIIWKYFGFTDLEFTWEDQTDVDPKVQAEIDQIYLSAYVISPEEVRARIGMEGPPPEKPAPPTFGPEGEEEEEGEEDGNTPVDDKGKLPDGSKADKDTGAAKPDKGGKSDQVSKVACGCDIHRAKKKSLKPLDRDRKAIAKQRGKAQKALTAFLKSAAKDIAGQLSEIMQTAERADVATKDEVDKILKQLDFSGWATLADVMQPVIEKSVVDGWQEAAKQISVAPSDGITDLLNDRAAAFAAERSASLVGMRRVGEDFMPNPNAKWAITETTREMLRGTVSTAIEEGWSTDKLAEEIEASAAFSESRAQTIARTEIAKADVEGNMQAYRSSGVVMGKEWATAADCCEDCQLLDGIVVGLDDNFPNDGGDSPPLHPQCRCDVLPVLMDKEGEEDGE